MVPEKELLNQFFYYMQTGGITMYPLLLCCFWMWLLIMYNLPVWKPSPTHRSTELQTLFQEQRRDNVRHNRRLYQDLLERSYKRSTRGMATIRVLASLAPFLGLFGTVTGMINTFESVTAFGLGNPKALASGISEAMITTQFGLLIALPGFLATFFLHRRAQRDQRKVRIITGNLLSEGR